jgi:hypothetical protein
MENVGVAMTRPAGEVVLIILAATVGVVLVVSVVMVGVLEVIDPAADTQAAQTGITSVVTVLAGTVVGFLAGRRQEAANAPQPPPQPPVG